MNRLLAFLLACLISVFAVIAQAQDSTPAASTNIDLPRGLVVDAAGNQYIAAWHQNRVFRVSRNGQLAVVAGNGIAAFSGDGGPATEAGLNAPSGVALDRSGNIYIADGANYRIRRVDAATGTITTVAGNGSYGFSGDGGPATAARMDFPYGLAVDGAGNLYVADGANNRIRRIDGTTGIITTVAGNGSKGYSGDGGPATSASLSWPSGVAVDGRGNLYIADTGRYRLKDTPNYRIRRVDAATGIITTVAGNGTYGYSGDGGLATAASLAQPYGLAIDRLGNLYIADTYNNRIRRVDAVTGIITTVAGNGSSGFNGDGKMATDASMHPYAVALDTDGNLYVADYYSNRVRQVAAATGLITTVAGNGVSSMSVGVASAATKE